MVYPIGSNLVARGVFLDPARHSGLLRGLNTLEQALQVVDRLSGIGDRCVTNLLTRDPSVVTAGTWARHLDAGHLWNGGYSNHNGPSVTLDEIIVNMYAPSSGTYSLRFNAPTRPDAGILMLYRGAAQIGAGAGYDLYSALVVPANPVVVAGLAMVAGSNPITFRIDGHNGASTAWDLWLDEIEIIRTA